MTYEELKAAYETAVQKCSELEKENDELKNRIKPESIGAEMNCVVNLKQKKSCIHFPKISGNAQSAAVNSCRFQKNI